MFGLASLGSPRVFARARAANGRMQFGRPFARDTELSSNFK